MTGHVSICVYMKHKQWKSLDTVFSRETCVQATKVLLLICTAHQQGADHEYSVVRKQELTMWVLKGHKNEKGAALRVMYVTLYKVHK